MNKKLTTRSSILKWFILGFCLVIISAVVTVVGIKLLYKTPAEKTATDSTNQVKTISSKDLIKSYTDTRKLDGFTLDTSIGNSILTYKLSDTAYSVQITSLDNVKFTKTENSTTDDLSQAADATLAFLTENKLTKSSERILTDSTQIQFDNQQTVCTYHSNQDSKTKASSYSLVCVEKTAIISERDSIKKLTELVNESEETATFKDVVQTVHVEDNKQLSILSINPVDTAKAPYTLLFAAIDDKWTYLGTRITPSVDVKDSFEISPQLTTAINDPKYDGFLAKYIQ